MIIGIYAKDLMCGIGKGDELPWPRLKEDMAHFKKVTTDNVIVMGRKTWDSLDHKKLPNRINSVISSQNIKGCDYCYNSIDAAITDLSWKHPTRNIFIIGGANILNQCIKNKKLDKLIVSTINAVYECDVFMDETFLNINYKKEDTSVIRNTFPRIDLDVYGRR